MTSFGISEFFQFSQFSIILFINFNFSILPKDGKKLLNGSSAHILASIECPNG